MAEPRKLTVTFTGAFRRRPYMVTDTDPPSDLNPLARFRSERDAHQFAASARILRERDELKAALEDGLDRIGSVIGRLKQDGEWALIADGHAQDLARAEEWYASSSAFLANLSTEN